MTKEMQNDNILPRKISKISEYIFEKLLGSKILRPDEKVITNGYKLQRQAILSSNKTHANIRRAGTYKDTGIFPRHVLENSIKGGR